MAEKLGQNFHDFSPVPNMAIFISPICRNTSSPDSFETNITNSYQLCGSAQCSFMEEGNSTSNDWQKYQIHSWEARIWLFLGFASLQVAAMLLQLFVLKDPSSYKWSIEATDEVNENEVKLVSEVEKIESKNDDNKAEISTNFCTVSFM